jgi:hypothetical protein
MSQNNAGGNAHQRKMQEKAVQRALAAHGHRETVIDPQIQKAIPTVEAIPKKTGWSKTKTVITAVGGAVGVGATFLAYVVLIPQLSVTATNPVAPNDPFSSTITIVHNRFYPLVNVTYGLSLGRVDFAGGGVFMGEKQYATALYPMWQKPQVLDDEHPIQFPANSIYFGNKEDLKHADVAILVDYDLPLIHWHTSKFYPFEVTRQRDGNFDWYSHPPSSPPKDIHRSFISKPIYLPTSEGKPPS